MWIEVSITKRKPVFFIEKIGAHTISLSLKMSINLLNFGTYREVFQLSIYDTSTIMKWSREQYLSLIWYMCSL